MRNEMDAADYVALRAKQKRQPKYHNRRVTVGDEHYDSQAEADRHHALLLLAQQGAISGLRRQVRFPIIIHGVLVTTYVADFTYFDHERFCTVIEDVKGYRTREYLLKKKLLRAAQGVEITEVDA